MITNILIATIRLERINQSKNKLKSKFIPASYLPSSK